MQLEVRKTVVCLLGGEEGSLPLRRGVEFERTKIISTRVVFMMNCVEGRSLALWRGVEFERTKIISTRVVFMMNCVERQVLMPV